MSVLSDESPEDHDTRLWICERILVQGVVQAVGFRPFVCTTARALGLSGTVANIREGVEILIEGPPSALTRFKESLVRHQPVLAHITGVMVESRPPGHWRGFSIETSREASAPSTFVPPDTAVCAACRRELEEPENRRHAYPFITCTDCGPRFTMVKALPFDRQTSTMIDFPMCPECRAEYSDPANRRFHAQAIGCPACGPKLALLDRYGSPITGGSVPDLARTFLIEGKILAIKGVGGFHLVADATHPDAVARLRTLKDRGDKPLAVMAASEEVIRSFAQIRDGEMEALQSPARPVVLLRKRTDPCLAVAAAVAPANPLIGVMLPYTALHLLLLRKSLTVLVMTSFNRKNEPMVRDTDEALSALSHMADAILTHNLAIHARCDDSVGRWIAGRFRVFRRSRGFAPLPLSLTPPGPSILATGGLMKNTVCLVKDGHAFLSQHVGDLETPQGFRFFRETADHMDRLFRVAPSVLVHDSHPDAPTAGLDRQYPQASVITVQHHHAHIVSCMVEHKFNDPVIGFAFDGTGYGNDGTLWGGEVLVATRVDYRRAAHLATVPMPGGAAAVKEPWRMGLSHLFRAFGPAMWDLDVPLIRKGSTVFDEPSARVLVTLMDRGVGSPQTSSMGRLFDAVAAILGLCYENTFDAQAAMTLEFCAIDEPATVPGYPVAMIQENDGVLVVDSAPLIRAVVSDLVSGVPQHRISARFHQSLIDQFTAIGARLADETGIPVAALSGGVFQNARLLGGLSKSLEHKGFSVLTHAQVPAGDGGLSLGQAAIAAARGLG